MSRSSVKDLPQLRFPQKGLSVYHRLTETKLGSEIQKLLHVFVFHFYQMLISPSLQRPFANRKDHLKAVICRYDTDLLIIFLVAVLLELFISIYFILNIE